MSDSAAYSVLRGNFGQRPITNADQDYLIAFLDGAAYLSAAIADGAFKEYMDDLAAWTQRMSETLTWEPVPVPPGGTPYERRERRDRENAD